MQKLFTIIGDINESMAKIISAGPFVMAVVVTYDVVLRYVFNAPTEFALEVNEYLLLTISWLGGGYVLKHKAHVNVDILYRIFPERAKAITNMITSILFFSFCGVLLWKGCEASVYSFQSHEATQIIKLPLFLFNILIPLGAFLIMVQGIVQFVQNLKTAIHGGGEDQEGEADTLGIKK
jgi:TRAP-type mannitol/chloroaromatic compound transport system permease small subunit